MNRIFLLIFLLWAVGCDKPAAVVPPKPAVPAGRGAIRGTVRYAGPPVVANVIGGECCPGAEPARDESVLVGPDLGLANVVVWIKDGPNIAGEPPLDRVLTQKNCQYIPHVLALRTNQVLNVTSHDPVPHNVHVEANLNPAENFAELQNASHALRFTLPETIRFKCDVHPWMTAYVAVFDHPCFDVTTMTGGFDLSRLPPGTYTVLAWHERLGTMEKSVTVADAVPSVVDFEFKPR